MKQRSDKKSKDSKALNTTMRELLTEIKINNRRKAPKIRSSRSADIAEEVVAALGNSAERVHSEDELEREKGNESS